MGKDLKIISYEGPVEETGKGKQALNVTLSGFFCVVSGKVKSSLRERDRISV